MDSLVEWGFLGVFVAAFLAATILPLSSEIVLTALLLNGLSPVLLIGLATAGNVLGSLVNYGLGYWANLRVAKRWLGISDEALSRAEQRFGRYGLWSLCFAWVPVIGDPLTLIAGLLRVPLGWFLVLVTIGKLLRYVVVGYLVLVV